MGGIRPQQGLGRSGDSLHSITHHQDHVSTRTGDTIEGVLCCLRTSRSLALKIAQKRSKSWVVTARPYTHTPARTISCGQGWRCCLSFPSLMAHVVLMFNSLP